MPDGIKISNLECAGRSDSVERQHAGRDSGMGDDALLRRCGEGVWSRRGGSLMHSLGIFCGGGVSINERMSKHQINCINK